MQIYLGGRSQGGGLLLPLHSFSSTGEIRQEQEKSGQTP